MERRMEYIGFRNKSCDIVRLNNDWFDFRPNESKIPTVGAFCNHCRKDTAKPVYSIYMNGKEAYALRCNKCGNEYAMYKSMFIERYVGYDTLSGGHVNPTYGTMNRKSAMNRKAIQRYNNIKSEVAETMCKVMNCTLEEYKEQKKKWDEERKKEHKKFENDMAEVRARYEDEQRKSESAKRKELIKKGVLKYKKGIGLVNTVTGEVVKL